MSAVALLFEDAEDLVIGAMLAPPWGVYLNGVPVIQPASVASAAAAGTPAAVVSALISLASVAGLIGQPSVGQGNLAPATASTIEFEFAQDWSLPTYPQEEGAFQAYNKVTLPFDVKIRLAGSGQAFLQNCLAIASSDQLFDIVTPELTFTGVNCSHIAVLPREARRGVSLLQVEFYFMQIPVVSSTTFQNTQQPGEAAPYPTGNQQPQTPSQYIQSQFAAGGVGSNNTGWTVQ
jgi:hypothetical protein